MSIKSLVSYNIHFQNIKYEDFLCLLDRLRCMTLIKKCKYVKDNFHKSTKLYRYLKKYVTLISHF